MLPKKGFTLVELLIILAVITTLLGFVVVNLLGAQRRASIDTVVDTLVTDLKQQQFKSISGETSRGNGLYGIHVGNNYYTLFQGTTFSSSDPSNLVRTDSVPSPPVRIPTRTWRRRDRAGNRR